MSLSAYPLVSDWLSLQDGRLRVHTGKVDIGQRISTALVQIAHEELSIPFDQIDIASVRTGHAPDEGMTSGSNSIEQSGHALRCAAATLRQCLMNLAVSRYGGALLDWQLVAGDLHLPGTNHRIRVTDLMGDIPGDVTVDQAAPFRPLTDDPVQAPPMRGLTDMVRGAFTFVHDLDVPGLQHARLVRPPHVKARLVEIPQAAIIRLDNAGVSLTRDGSFLAVSGPQEWPVVKAAQTLAAACVWDPQDGLLEDDVFAKLVAENAQRRYVVEGTPTGEPIPPQLEQPDLAARYERPYQMHAPLAPSAALAHWQGDILTVHSQSQGIYPLRQSIADSLGLAARQVNITHVPGSGCYGHTGADDAAFEASLIALDRPGVPILLKWTRADEHAWEPYAPAMAVDIAAKLRAGRIQTYSAEAFSDTHGGRPRSGPNQAGPARLLSNRFRADPVAPFQAKPAMAHQVGIHRNLQPIYVFPQNRLVKNLVTGLVHRSSAMRCLGGAANLFALESFMDELARQEDRDPFALRRDYLSDPRDLDVLNALEREVGKTQRLGGRGIAYGQYKNHMARVGICVDIEMTEGAQIHLRHVTIVADAGRVIDADGLAAQLEGGCVQAASWALYEQVTWDRDGIQSRDWQSYPVIRFDNVPEIRVRLLDHPMQKSLGAGEASCGPMLAALANAVFDATGLRLRRLPFTPDAIRRAAYAA